MFKVLTIEKRGDQNVVVLSDEIMEFLELRLGDRVSLSKQREPVEPDPEFDRQLEVAAEGMKRYQRALRKLAE